MKKMSDVKNFSARRQRGRPKKTVNYASLAGFANVSRPPSFPSKRKQEVDSSDEIQILSVTTVEPVQLKKPKTEKTEKEELSQPKRSLPHRAARFTESYGGSPDVVIVSDDDAEESESDSDSDCGPIPSPVIKTRTKEEQKEWEATILKLKKQLNDEEMKLILLRKLQESQKTKDVKTEANGNSGSPAPPTSQANQNFPIIKKNTQSLTNKQLLSNNKYLMKKDVKPDIQPSNNDSQKPSNNGSQRQTSSPSPVPLTVKDKEKSNVPAASSNSLQVKSNALNQYPLLKNLSNQITVTPVPAQNPVINKPEEKIDAETIYQRQAAAKLALRKQLEKTLLQIPLPKPPPLKINFFPNANSIEFLCLLGLDYVVDFLTKIKKEKKMKQPLSCCQCSTDFTCAWKWKEIEKNGRKVYDVFCEACINSNIRKALKAQHTNNLKAAFLKALQQEKEIDRLSQTIPKSHSSSREHRQNSRLPTPSPAHQPINASVNVPKIGTTVTYIPKPPPSNVNHATLAQVGKLNPQFQSLLQAQAHQFLASGVPFNPNVLSLTSFVPPPSTHYGKSSTGQTGFRRQYQSDRTQSPSIPPSGWKS